MSTNKKLENFKSLLRKRGFELRLNWSAPRWKGDKALVCHYTIIGENRRPRMATCILIDYGADGFGFYGDSPSNNINADIEAICGECHTECDAS